MVVEEIEEDLATWEVKAVKAMVVEGITNSVNSNRTISVGPMVLVTTLVVNAEILHTDTNGPQQLMTQWDHQ